MHGLAELWKTRIPKYDNDFRAELFDMLSKKGGGSERSKIDLGKHFANNYELYMYAFFLGLYKGEEAPIVEGAKKVDFSHAIQFWGSKANRLDRKDFTRLQDFMFMALVAKTDIDLIALERGEIDEKDVVRDMMTTMESYTNGGLMLISEKLEENPNYFLRPTAFLDLIKRL